MLRRSPRGVSRSHSSPTGANQAAPHRKTCEPPRALQGVASSPAEEQVRRATSEASKMLLPATSARPAAHGTRLAPR